MDFKHYILTRFNLGVYSDNNPYRQHVGDAEQWMAHRLDLFERLCLPSVLSQTWRNFTWLLAFDEDTPRRILLRYDYIDNVQIIYEQPHLWLRRQKPECEWLLTSRIDNDDWYAPQFAERLQDAFMERTEVVDVNYEAVDLNTSKHYASGRRRANSPFLSLYEPWGNNPMTAMGRPHSIMPDIYSSRRLDGVLAYQGIHGKNVCNKIPQ